MCYPETLEVPIRGRVQLRILELGDEAGEKQKKAHMCSQQPRGTDRRSTGKTFEKSVKGLFPACWKIVNAHIYAKITAFQIFHTQLKARYESVFLICIVFIPVSRS